MISHVGQTCGDKRRYTQQQKRAWARKLWSSKPVERRKSNCKKSSDIAHLEQKVPINTALADTEEDVIDPPVQNNQVDWLKESDGFDQCYPVVGNDLLSRTKREKYNVILSVAIECQSSNVY